MTKNLTLVYCLAFLISIAFVSPAYAVAPDDTKEDKLTEPKERNKTDKQQPSGQKNRDPNQPQRPNCTDENISSCG